MTSWNFEPFFKNIEVVINSYVFAFTLIFVLLIRVWLNNRHLPPGPWGLPLVGYLPFLVRHPEIKFSELSKKYGNIWSFSAGSKLVVVLGDYAAIKEAFVKHGDVFSGRPEDFIFQISKDENGLVTSEGELWQKQRRFVLSVMKDYGMGKLSLEIKIQEEIRMFLNELAKHNGKPIDPQHILGLSLSNNISSMEFGKRFDYSDGNSESYYSIVEATQKLFKPLLIRSFLPWIKYIPFSDQYIKFSELVKTRSKLDSLFREEIIRHEEQHINGSQTDYIDAYLTHRHEVYQRKGNEDVFDKKVLEGNLLQMFAAGVDTVTSTLRWALLFMMLHPEVQKRVQNEIDEVVGMYRIPSTKDRSRMPYTEATIMEISRCASVVPLNVVHSNVREITFLGYRIPKRTYILSNLYAIHHDAKHWKNPEDFDPLRFIDTNGALKTSEFLIPFSIGKRSCIGESFARMELFLYFTSILQRFIISPPTESALSLDYEVEIVRSPADYQLCAIPRPEYDVT